MTLSGLQVLYVDDHQWIREIATIALEMDPEISVRTASSGPAALAMLTDRWRPDVILLDVMMPLMEGPKVLEILRRDRGDETPVIYVTAKALPGDRDLLVGSLGVIPKPFDPLTLSQQVRALMAGAARDARTDAAAQAG